MAPVEPTKHLLRDLHSVHPLDDLHSLLQAVGCPFLEELRGDEKPLKAERNLDEAWPRSKEVVKAASTTVKLSDNVAHRGHRDAKAGGYLSGFHLGRHFKVLELAIAVEDDFPEVLLG